MINRYKTLKYQGHLQKNNVLTDNFALFALYTDFTHFLRDFKLAYTAYLRSYGSVIYMKIDRVEETNTLKTLLKAFAKHKCNFGAFSYAMWPTERNFRHFEFFSKFF